jgi:hypothetical protein
MCRRPGPQFALFVAFGWLLLNTDAPSGAAEPAAFDTAAILKRSRETYEKLSTYHFEHVLEVDESKIAGSKKTESKNTASKVDESKAGDRPAGAEKSVRLARLTFVTAADGAKYGPNPGEVFNLPLIADRCRWELRDGHGTKLLVSAADESYYYDSEKKEYARGRDFTDHFSSVGSAIFLNILHIVFFPLTEGGVHDLKPAGEADISRGKESRKCYVVEGTIPAPPPIDFDNAKEPPDVTGHGMHLDFLVSMLGMHGLLGRDNPTQYSTHRLDEERPKPGDPTRITLWIDQESHLILRSRLSARLFKYPLDPNAPDDFEPRPGSEQGEQVHVTATFHFTTAKTGADVPKSVFEFTPPAGSKEVPNIRTPAGEKK